jgi:uncharacterized protein YndB with AHSA1/START domain
MSSQEFVINRTFDAPRDLVWKAFTEPERMAAWWGPPGSKLHAASMDFRPGGRYHFGAIMPDGNLLWGLFTYVEINPVERLVYLHSFSDEAGAIAASPFGGPWPARIHTTLTFTEQDGVTAFTLRQHPIDASPEEVAAFAALYEGMTLGWGGTFDRLDDYLRERAA